MNRNYLYLTMLMLALAGGLFVLPERNNEQGTLPEELMWDIVQPTRYATTDQVARMIIEKDPTIELIDVRPFDEYTDFSLPGAVNIPLDSIVNENYQDYLGIQDMNAVFFSDDDIKADQAWVIARRMGYDNIYVMRGGLNCWVETIIRPEKPDETASRQEFEKYILRKGASMYFVGGAKMDENTGSKKTNVAVKRKKKAAVAEGGC
ncbi:MAG: rhodanese-like domain-containing protein [Bacteroidales bacterium]|nr:rhodanese-like domain-containing protein [Bacteroidales bacterium]